MKLDKNNLHTYQEKAVNHILTTQMNKETLIEMFEYKKGKLYNKYTRNPRALQYSEIGSKHHSGYRQVQISGKLYMVHRLIWIIYNDEIPSGMEIDHINHIRDDNRLINLRLVTRQDNRRNQKLTARNTSGTMGVYLIKKSNRWCAQIKVDGKVIYLGTYSIKKEAIEVRKKAETTYGFYKNHGGK